MKRYVIHLSLLLAVALLISGAVVGGTIGSVLIGGTFSLIGALGAQGITSARERRLRFAEMQQAAIYALQDAMKEAQLRLGKACEANRSRRSQTDPDAVEFLKLVVVEINTLSSRVFDDRLRAISHEYQQASLLAFNSGERAPGAPSDAENKLKEFNARVPDVLRSIFELR